MACARYPKGSPLRRKVLQAYRGALEALGCIPKARRANLDSATVVFCVKKIIFNYL
jgi:hypothetical protein